MTNTIAPPAPSRRLGWKPWLLLLLLLGCLLGARGMQVNVETCGWFDRTVRHTGCVRALPGHTGGIMRTYVAYAPDGRLATQSAGVVRIWPAEGDEPVWMQTGTGELAPPSFSPDGAWLALGDQSGAVALKSLDQPDWAYQPAERTLPARQGRITALGWSGDSRLLISGGDDGRVLVQRVDDGTLVREWSVGEPESAAIAPDGRTVAILTKKALTLHDVTSGRTLRTLSDGHSFATVAFAPDGTRLAATLRDSTIRIWRVADGVQEHTLRFAPSPRSSNTTGVVVPVAVAWSPDGRWIAGGGSAGWGVWVWDASTGALRTKILPPPMGGSVGLRSIAFAPHGQQLVADGIIVDNSEPIPSRSVHIWQLPD